MRRKDREVMKTKKEYALELRSQRYNCCQAVACAFAEEVNIDQATLFRAAQGFGSGMGNMKGVCGALTGAVVLAGLKNSVEAIPSENMSTIQLSKEMSKRFEEKCGAIICGDLKGVSTGKMLCSCPDCIANAVEIVQEVLNIS